MFSFKTGPVFLEVEVKEGTNYTASCTFGDGGNPKNIEGYFVPYASTVMQQYVCFFIIQGVPKKTGPAYVSSHPDYNFIPMKLKF